MIADKQILLFLSVLGGFNTLFLALYFVFVTKKNKASGYFLGALLLTISVRTIKSVFFYFNRELSEIFIQAGLSACILVGPFLYLYIRSWKKPGYHKNWYLHVFPAFTAIVILGILYPYYEFRPVWSPYIVRVIYLQWFIYLLLSGLLLKQEIAGLFNKAIKLKGPEIWVLNIYAAIFLVWLGYNIGSYTSYLTGAVTFSVVFYLMVVFWVFRSKSKNLFYEEADKYENRKITSAEAKDFKARLEDLIEEKALYRNANLKLADVAKELHVLPHYLSQYLNDNEGLSFSAFINRYRITAARKLLEKQPELTAEAIGYQCGFNSKSTFFSSFKKYTGLTPAGYKNSLSASK